MLFFYNKYLIMCANSISTDSMETLIPVFPLIYIYIYITSEGLCGTEGKGCVAQKGRDRERKGQRGEE